MFGFNIMGDMPTVTLEIYQGNALTQQQQIAMPVEMLQAQFMQIVQQAAQLHGKQPIRVKMWQTQYFKDPNSGDDIPREISIEFQNWFDDEGEHNEESY